MLVFSENIAYSSEQMKRPRGFVPAKRANRAMTFSKKAHEIGYLSSIRILETKGGKPVEDWENEVLRYLGYKKVNRDLQIRQDIQKAYDKLKAISKAQATWQAFEIKAQGEEIFLADLNWSLPGQAIRAHLEKSQRCVLMAVTLGYEIERLIQYTEHVSLREALILDACANVEIEKFADEEQLKIQEHFGMYTTERFSPGYGDLPLSVQSKLLAVLEAHKKIGLSVNAQSILLPRKSITALIGIQKEKSEKLCRGCNHCDKKDCLFRKNIGNR